MSIKGLLYSFVRLQSIMMAKRRLFCLICVLLTHSCLGQVCAESNNKCVMTMNTMLSTTTTTSTRRIGTTTMSNEDICESKAVCKDRCGEIVSANHTCACDEDCILFGDCCHDYSDYCKNGEVPDYLGQRGELDCSPIPHRGFLGTKEKQVMGMYIVSSCPSMNKSEPLESILCSWMSPENRTFHRGVWYRNDHCKICWEGQQESSLLQKLRNSRGFRPCILEMMGCLRDEAEEKFSMSVVKSICYSYVRPGLFPAIDVTTPWRRRTWQLYRNRDCYNCQLGQLSSDQSICYDPDQYYGHLGSYSNSLEGREGPAGTPSEGYPYYWRILERSFVPQGLPDSISLLITFGVDNKGLVYNAESAHQCEEREMWDPFARVCRVVFCPSNVDTADLACSANHSDLDAMLDDLPKQPVVKPLKEVNISLGVWMNEWCPEELRCSLEDTVPGDHASMELDFRAKLANVLLVPKYRFANLTMQRLEDPELRDLDELYELFGQLWNNDDFDHEIPSLFLIRRLALAVNASLNVRAFRVNLLVTSAEATSSGELPVGRIISLFTELIARNLFVFNWHQYRVRVNNMRQETESADQDLAQWCRGGKLRTYVHLELDIRLLDEHGMPTYNGNWTIEVTVKETNQTYRAGQFAANLIFQGMNSEDRTNFTGIVCEDRAFLNSSTCSKTLFPSSEFSWPEEEEANVINFTGPAEVYGIENPLEPDDYTYYPALDEVLVCVVMPVYPFASDLAERIVSALLLLISTISLLATLITHSLFKELRNLPGLNLMALAFSIVTYQIIFLVFMNPHVAEYHPELCRIVAIATHATVLASFFWTNIMAWDIFKTFGRRSIFSRVRPKRYFFKYASYVYGVTLTVMCFAMLIEYSQVFPSWRIGYGDHSCFLGNTQASLLFVALPVSCVLVANLILFVCTIASINYVSRTAVRDRKHRKRGQKDVLLYLRIFGILGFAWLFGIAMIFVSPGSTPRKILSFLFVIFQGMQGFFIFSVFTFNARVLALYKRRFKRIQLQLAQPSWLNSSSSPSSSRQATRRTRSDESAEPGTKTDKECKRPKNKTATIAKNGSRTRRSGSVRHRRTLTPAGALVLNAAQVSQDTWGSRRRSSWESILQTPATSVTRSTSLGTLKTIDSKETICDNTDFRMRLSDVEEASNESRTPINKHFPDPIIMSLGRQDL